MLNKHGLWLDALGERKESKMRFKEWLRHNVWAPLIASIRYQTVTDDPVVGYASARARDWLSDDVRYRCIRHYYTAGDLASGWYPVHKSDAEMIGLECFECKMPRPPE